MLAVVSTTCLQQCNKALNGEPFSFTISNDSVSLLRVVDVNRVLLVAAAPLQAFSSYSSTPTSLPSTLFHPSTGEPSLQHWALRDTIGNTSIQNQGNSQRNYMNNYIFPLCCYPQSVLQLLNSSDLNGVHVCWDVCSCRKGILELNLQQSWSTHRRAHLLSNQPKPKRNTLAPMLL